MPNEPGFSGGGEQVAGVTHPQLPHKQEVIQIMRDMVEVCPVSGYPSPDGAELFENSTGNSTAHPHGFVIVGGALTFKAQQFASLKAVQKMSQSQKSCFTPCMEHYTRKTKLNVNLSFHWQKNLHRQQHMNSCARSY